MAETIQGVFSVVDGDTLSNKSYILRLQGIDAPETRQRCVEAAGHIVRPSQASVARLKQLVSSRVTCKLDSSDTYGRRLATCWTADGLNINSTLVREGLAWAFRRYSTAYIAAEDQARSEQLQIWKLKCQAPWTFRQQSWSISQTSRNNNCNIKGNVSARGKIYHMPWNEFYSRTSINESNGDRWFCDENAARQAGFRPAQSN